MPELTRKHLEHFAFNPHAALTAEVAQMATELIAARARIAELEQSSTARLVSTTEELDALAFSFPCVVREIPPENELEFYPQIWEKTFQTDGWARAGRMHDEADCTPTLPVEVIAVEVSER